jgi:hypothetical protein
MTALASSEAMFGSWSRGDNDVLSDRDILIVDADLQVLRERASALKKEGWSVAAYTFAKLEALSEIGALFLQHLKIEARITVDNQDRLRIIIDNFRPKVNYREEIAINNNLFALAACRPATKLGGLWAADVLYVAVRNWGIMTLAEVGCHTYAYSDVLERLSENGIIEGKSIGPLLKLRLVKALYRSSESVPSDHIRRMLNGVAAGLPIELSRNFIEAKPADILDSNSLPANAPAYHRLRRLERSYVALKALRPHIEGNSSLDLLRGWIANPRAYAFLASRSEPELDDLFRKIANNEVLGMRKY